MGKKQRHHQQHHHHHHEQGDNCMNDTNAVPLPNPPDPQPEPTPAPTPVEQPTPPGTDPAVPAPPTIPDVVSEVKSDIEYAKELAVAAREEYLKLAPELQGRIHQLFNDLESMIGDPSALANLHTLFGGWSK